MIRILVMGLPKSGKTTLAKVLVERLRWDTVSWFNADELRKAENDWDFSYEGRIRQANRMRALADAVKTRFVICDFIAALPAQRQLFEPHFVIWMDTVKSCDYEDTDRDFVPPDTYRYRITERNSDKIDEIITDIRRLHG